MPRLFEVGGGAGIGSYIVVIQDGQLLNPNAEKIRASYDNGENLYLSILDESTQEALLPLTGYVDNEGILHLAGRDFDDNKTYDLAINNGTQSIELNTVDGITMGEGTIPTEGGGGDITLKTINNTSLKGEGNLELVDLSSDQTIMGDKTFGSFRQSTVTKFYGNLASVDTIDANGIHFGAESGKRPIDASRLLAYNTSDYAGQGKTLYAGNGITYYYKTYEEGQLIERSYKLDFPDHKNGIIATTDDIPDDSNLVHKGTSSSPSNETIYGEKSFGGTVNFGAYNAGAGGFLSEGSISSASLSSLNLSADRQLVLSAKGYDLPSSGFSFKDYYKPSGSSTTYTSTYKFPDRKAENKSYVIATTEDPAPAVQFLTAAPTANNTGSLKFVVLSSEPATKYDGYIYIITGSN